MVASVLFGVVFEAYKVTAVIPTAFYLAMCFAQTIHSIEEYLTHFWEHITEASMLPFEKHSEVGGTSKMDRYFFIVFNIAFDGLMFLFYLFLIWGAAWSWVFVLGMAVIGIGNGILHCGTALQKRKYFSGCISAVFTLIIGAMILASISIHL
jgi:hypothetical protein